VQDQAPDGLADVPSHDGTLDLEQEKNVLPAAIQRLEIRLAFGDDQVGARKPPLELRAAVIEHDAGPIAAGVHQGDQTLQAGNLGVG
jgi:hypothetical protein